MKKFKKINNEVFYTKKKIPQIDNKDILFLKSNANKTKKKRIRICTHLNQKDHLQEMFIALSNKTYIRPHKHFNKSESLHVIYGSADVISLSKYSHNSSFYYRISKPVYHTFIIKSDCFIFHETTQGPLKKSDSVYAPWSPKDTEFKKIILFKKKLFQDVERLSNL